MNRTPPTAWLRQPLVTGVLCLSVFFFVAPKRARAQQPPPTCVDWNAVQSWNGTISISGAGTATDQVGEVFTVSEAAIITFTGATPDPVSFGPCPSTLNDWVASGSQVSISVTVHDSFTVPSCTVTTWDVSNGIGTGDVYLAFNMGNPSALTYNFGYSSLVNSTPPMTITTTGSGTQCSSSSATGSAPVGPVQNRFIGAGYLASPIALPSTLSTLSGSTSFQQADAVSPINTNITWNLSWNFTPVLPPLDAVVTIDGSPSYAAWRPMAGMNEAAIGNFLVISGALVSKTTGEPVAVGADQWTFTLKNFSSEPGVTLNWPPADHALSLPDFDFKDPLNSTLEANIVVSPDGTSVQVLPDPNYPSGLSAASLVLDSHDWGAWATLNVSVTVADQATPIEAHIQLPNGQTVTDIPIPLITQPGSHIADIWKTQHNVPLSTPDSDDSEPNPVGYQDCVGDGFTLYEEYRGFMENGKHIEGDPNNKDFFIENIVGANAEPGIWEFTQLSGLTVHKDIQKNETKIDHPNGAFGSILVNFNHSQGAHVTDQHGVTIAAQYQFPDKHGQPVPLDGGITVLSVAGVHGKPRITDGIAIQYKNRIGTLNPNNTHLGVITPVAASGQYDLGVAHELMHPIQVDHHGDNDAGYTLFQFSPPNTPQNPTSTVKTYVGNQQVQLWQEQGTPGDQSTLFWQSYQQALNQCQAISADPFAYPGSVAYYCASLFNATGYNNSLVLYVGSPQQQHSGDDQCIMRYFFANTYPSSAPNSGIYYLVPQGTEPLGGTLCTSPTGTGINDPDRTPQPRYFNASPGRGGCQFWICVSDNTNYALIPD
jgi:hypothetical protein